MDWFNTWVKRYDESVTEHVTKGTEEYKPEFRTQQPGFNPLPGEFAFTGGLLTEREKAIKGSQGASVWETLSPEERRMVEEENLSFGPGSAGEGLVSSVLKQVTRIAVIIIVGLIGILAFFQLLPVEVRR